MNSGKLFEAFSYIDDEHLKTVDTYSNKMIAECSVYKTALTKENVKGDIVIKNTSKKLGRILLIAAVITSLMSLAAYAIAEYLQFRRYEEPDNMIIGFYDSSNIESGDHILEYDDDGKILVNLYAWERIPVDETVSDALIAPYICAVDVSGTYGDYTVTVEAHLYDPLTTTGIVYYTVENPNGVSGYEVSPNGMLSWSVEPHSFSTLTNQAGRAYIDNSLSTDTKLYICESYITFGFGEEYVALKYGDLWDYTNPLEILISYEQQEQIPGKTFADAIDISPIGIRTNCAALGLNAANDLDSIVLKYADGTEYIVFNNSESLDNSMYALISDNQGTERRLFNRIVDINQIVEVVVNGVGYTE